LRGPRPHAIRFQFGLTDPERSFILIFKAKRRFHVMNKDVTLDRNGLLCPVAKIKIAQKTQGNRDGRYHVYIKKLKD